MHGPLSSGIVLAIAQNVRNVLSCHQRVISRLWICVLALLWIGAPLFAQTSPLPMLQFERRGDDSQATFLAEPFAIYSLMASSSPAGPWTPVSNLPSGLVNPVFGSGRFGGDYRNRPWLGGQAFLSPPGHLTGCRCQWRIDLNGICSWAACDNDSCVDDGGLCQLGHQRRQQNQPERISAQRTTHPPSCAGNERLARFS